MGTHVLFWLLRSSLPSTKCQVPTLQILLAFKPELWELQSSHEQVLYNFFHNLKLCMHNLHLTVFGIYVFFSFWDWIELFFFRMKKAPFVFLMLSKQSWLCYAFKITCHLVRFHSLIYSLRRSSSSASSTHCRGRRKRDKTNCIVACYPIPDKVLFYEQMENCSGSIAS